PDHRRQPEIHTRQDRDRRRREQNRHPALHLEMHRDRVAERERNKRERDLSRADERVAEGGIHEFVEGIVNVTCFPAALDLHYSQIRSQACPSEQFSGDTAMRHRSIGPFLVAAICCLAISIQAQDRPPISPGVGSAVFLATNSIELDRGVGITSGDLVVNGAPSGPVYGSASLALGRNAATAAGYKLITTSVALDRDATAGGDVYYNTLHNDGNINGSLFTPLAIPVFATLPGTAVRTPGTENIVVPPFGEIELEERAYGSLTVGRAATVHFLGGGYAFTSIIVDRGSALRFALPSDLVLNGRLSLDRETVVAPEAGSGFNASAIRIQVDGINGSNGALRSKPSAVDVGLGARVFATLQAMNGSIVFDREVEGIGAFIARDIFAGRDGHYAISSGFNQPPVANAQTVTTTGTDP